MNTVKTTVFVLRDGADHIELCSLLKLAGIASSGGQGKAMVAGGEATVNGQPELRKTAKIRAGQTVDCLGQRVLVQGE